MKNITFLSLLFLSLINFSFTNIHNVPSNNEDNVIPVNDTCDNAIALNCEETVVGETITATDTNSNGSADVYFEYTGTGLPEHLIVSLCDGSTDYDSFIRVYDDCSLANLIVENDDDCGLQSQVLFDSDGTSTYIIVIEGFSDNVGNFSLNLNCVPIDPNEPPNNFCNNAIELICNETVVGSTEFATDTGGNEAPDVYYSYTGPGTPEVITLSLCDGATNYDSWLRVFDDCDLNNELYSNDDTCGLQSEITFVSDGTSSYYIMIEGYQANFGEYSLEMTCVDFVPAPNDECDGAIAVACGDIQIGNTMSSLDHGGNSSPDVFYKYTGTGTSEIVIISLCDGGTDYNSYLRVFEDCTLNELISENDNFCGQQSQVSFQSDGVSTYYIMVEGNQNSSGNFSLEVSCAQPQINDTCDNAINVECGDVIVGETITATDTGGNSSTDIYYNYTGDGEEEWVTLSLCDGNTNYNSRLLVYDDCSFNELLSENTNFCGQQSQLTFYSDGVSNYIIIIEGGQGGSGNFSLEITCEPILGVDDTIFDSFSFYPNPSDNSIHISALQIIENVSIYNMLGQEIISEKIEALNSEINISNLVTGNYLIKVSINGFIGTYKLVKM
ncbi:MAG: T9SS type A sorting domain-containing protein [Flavobacteriaceae bacterium]|nr:T9SS type A sorting domain-containing protein [Flavobacteriaceae bacterium]